MSATASPEEIRKALRTLQKTIHDTARSKGWWDDHTNLQEMLRVHGAEFDIDPELGNVLFRTSKSMLAVTEIAEGVEALRKGDPPDDKLPEFTGQTVEIADDIIRQFDLAARFDLPVIEAILAKMEYNDTREHMHGGKAI